MADVTITGLDALAPATNTYVPISNGTTTGKAIYNPVPVGGIIMWSGSVVSIPAGWSLCNGTNGTPNLVDRFIVGAGASTPAVGATGGSKDAVVVSHTHTVTDPGHTHTVPVWYIPGSPFISYRASAQPIERDAVTTSITNSVTTGISIAAAGSSGTNANLPPYYALAYIMRTI